MDYELYSKAVENVQKNLMSVDEYADQLGDKELNKRLALYGKSVYDMLQFQIKILKNIENGLNGG